MKRRIAKKIVNLFAKSETYPNYWRRDLVIKAHQTLKLGIPELPPEFTKASQEPKAKSVGPGVSNVGTQNTKGQNPDTSVAAKPLTSKSTLKSTSYTDMRVPDLKALCKERGIKGYSKLNREGLVEALLNAS